MAYMTFSLLVSESRIYSLISGALYYHSGGSRFGDWGEHGFSESAHFPA